MNGKYILVDKIPVEAPDLLAWGRWMETADRTVAHNLIRGIRISTVFLGLDHNFEDGPPLLFETMIFGGEHSDYQTRAATWDEAEHHHAVAVALASTPTSPVETP